MKLKAPNAFVLLTGILTLVALLTWVIPPGEYERTTTGDAGGHGRVEVVPGTFQQLPDEASAGETLAYAPQGPWDVLQAPLKGMVRGASTIGFILLIGGAFGVLQATGALIAGLHWLTRHARGAGRFWVIPILMFVFSLGGAIFGMAEETLLFVLITVPLACSLGFDTVTGVAIPFVGSQAGFAAAFINPFTLGVASDIADQPVSDAGFNYRVLCWVLITALCCGWVLWHARRVAADPSRSMTPELDAKWRNQTLEGEAEDQEFTLARQFTLVVFGLSMALLGYGAVKEDWYTTEISAVFLGMALVCGLVGRLSLDRISESFFDGCKDLCSTAVLVGFAQAIFIVADQAKIIDTMLHSLAGMVEGSSAGAGVQLMYFTQTCINFFVPSGSGQAAMTMPLMAPLADLLGIHRENAILAFQFGDGFTNLIIPTSPICVGVATASGLGYGNWFRWMIKLQLVLFAAGATLLYFAPDFGA